jgi:hypothetical protein
MLSEVMVAESQKVRLAGLKCDMFLLESPAEVRLSRDIGTKVSCSEANPSMSVFQRILANSMSFRAIVPTYCPWMSDGMSLV